VKMAFKNKPSFRSYFPLRHNSLSKCRRLQVPTAAHYISLLLFPADAELNSTASASNRPSLAPVSVRLGANLSDQVFGDVRSVDGASDAEETHVAVIQTDRSSTGTTQ